MAGRGLALSEKRDLWVPLALAAAGLALLAGHLVHPAGSVLTGVLGAVVGLGGALACLPIRMKGGAKRLWTFGLGVALLLVPLVPRAESLSLASTCAWFVVALAFLVPLGKLPPLARPIMLGAAALFAILGLLAVMGVLPSGATWLLLAGSLYMAVQVLASRPEPVVEVPTGPLVCVYGGSFDPFHRGHRALCEAALRVHDRLLVVVAGSAPHKFAGEEGEASEVTPFHHRVAMTRLGVTGLPRTEVLELEGRRSGPSYTVDTLEVVRRSHPQGTRFRLLLGADMYADFATWHEWRRILTMVELVVAARPGTTLVDPPELESLGIAAVRLEAPQVDVSSTALRARLAAGEDVGDLLASGVRQYIAEHALYRGPAAPPSA